VGIFFQNLSEKECPMSDQSKTTTPDTETFLNEVQEELIRVKNENQALRAAIEDAPLDVKKLRKRVQKKNEDMLQVTRETKADMVEVLKEYRELFDHFNELYLKVNPQGKLRLNPSSKLSRLQNKYRVQIAPQ
jgi:hypothetical protein